MPTYNSIISRSDAQAMVPEQVSQIMLANLSAQSAALSLGKNIPIATNQTRFPVLSALPTAYFVNGDTGLKQTTEAAWDSKFINVEEIATIVPIPENVLDDASFDVWGYLRPLMEAAIVRKLDAAVFFGADAPGSWPTNIVAGSVAAGNVVARGTNNAAAGGIYGDFSDLLGTLEADGYDATGGIASTTIKARLRNTRATTGEQLNTISELPTFQYPMRGIWPSGLSAAEAVVGDFDHLVVGVRKDMTYTLATEGVITDNAGNIIYNLFQQDMVALRLVFRAGWQVSNPINYDQGTEASRYPFAVLRSPSS